MVDIIVFGLIPGLIVVAVLAVLGYLLYLKKYVDLPLQNEDDLEEAAIWLPQLGKFNQGRITTARSTFQSYWARMITASNESEQKALLPLRDKVLDYHLIAQKAGRDKFIYVFDKDPLDPRFHGQAPGTSLKYIGPVQDSFSIGNYKGFEYIGVKLGTETVKFTDDERSVYSTMLHGLSIIRVASETMGRLKFLEERNKTLETVMTEERGKHAETRSKLDRALTALEQKTLSTTGEAKVPGGFAMKLKQWFTWPQLICAAVFYFVVAPLVISMFAPTSTPPTTTYMTAGVTLVGFFVIPVFRKVFGRWL